MITPVEYAQLIVKLFPVFTIVPLYVLPFNFTVRAVELFLIEPKL